VTAPILAALPVVAGATADPLTTTTDRLIGIDDGGRLLVEQWVVVHDPEGERPSSPPHPEGCVRYAVGADPVALDAAACRAARTAFRAMQPASESYPVQLDPDPLSPYLLIVVVGDRRRVLASKAWFDDGGWLDSSLATSDPRTVVPPEIAWFAEGSRRAAALHYTAPDVFGNAIAHVVWVPVPDLAALPAADPRPCAELRPSGPARDVRFEQEVTARLEDRMIVVRGPPVDHPRPLPQVLYRDGYALAARTLSRGWDTAVGHDTVRRYDEMRCALTVISPRP
jgi:hypothetical protein